MTPDEFCSITGPETFRDVSLHEKEARSVKKGLGYRWKKIRLFEGLWPSKTDISKYFKIQLDYPASKWLKMLANCQRTSCKEKNPMVIELIFEKIDKNSKMTSFFWPANYCQVLLVNMKGLFCVLCTFLVVLLFCLDNFLIVVRLSLISGTDLSF